MSFAHGIMGAIFLGVTIFVDMVAQLIRGSVSSTSLFYARMVAVMMAAVGESPKGQRWLMRCSQCGSKKQAVLFGLDAQQAISIQMTEHHLKIQPIHSR